MRAAARQGNVTVTVGPDALVNGGGGGGGSGAAWPASTRRLGRMAQTMRFGYYQTPSDGLWRMSWLGGNSEIMASTQGFASKRNVLRAIQRFNDLLIVPLPVVEIDPPE